MSQLIGAAIQFTIGEMCLLLHQGNGIGVVGRLLFEQLVHTHLLRIGSLGGIPRVQQQGPLAVAHCIEAVDRGLDMPLDDAIALEASYFGLLSASRDKAEGMRAFLDKRPTRFEGR